MMLVLGRIVGVLSGDKNRIQMKVWRIIDELTAKSTFSVHFPSLRCFFSILTFFLAFSFLQFSAQDLDQVRENSSKNLLSAAAALAFLTHFVAFL